MYLLIQSISADGRSWVPEIKDRDSQDDRLSDDGFPSVMIACFDIDTPSSLLARDIGGERFIVTFECADDAYTEIAEVESEHFRQWEVCRLTKRGFNRRETAGILHKWALTDVPEVIFYE